MKTFRKVSAFDLDHTLIKGNTSWYFFYYMFKQKKLSPLALIFSIKCYLGHNLFGTPLRKIHERVFKKYLHKRKFVEFEEIATQFIRKYVLPNLYQPAIEKLEKAKKAGHYVAIFSNSPAFIVNPVAECLGANESMGSEYAVDSEGYFETILGLCEGKNKAEKLVGLAKRFGIEKKDLYAYSDSHLDLEFLQASGNATVVNPNRTLRRLSKEYNWPVI